MVNLQLYSRGESKEYMELLFNQINENNYTDARNTADNLKNCLLKYYLTRDVDCSVIYDTFDEFDFLLRRCNNNSRKKTILFDFLKRLRNISKIGSIHPVSRLSQLYEDLRYAYLHLKDKDVSNEIIDIFDEIRELKPKFQELGDTSYNYYTSVLESIGDCESVLVDYVSIQGIKPSNTTVTKLTSSFQNLFKSVQKVIAPPIRISLTPAEIGKQLKHQPLSEIAKATGHREEELQMMLNQISGDET